jgi:hypothetical protein
MPAPRFYEQAHQTGATAGQITSLESVQKLLDLYNVQRGWDTNGLPSVETLARLGLIEEANSLMEKVST